MKTVRAGERVSSCRITYGREVGTVEIGDVKWGPCWSKTSKEDLRKGDYKCPGRRRRSWF